MDATRGTVALAFILIMSVLSIMAKVRILYLKIKFLTLYRIYLHLIEVHIVEIDLITTVLKNWKYH